MRGVEMESRRKLSSESESKQRRIDIIGKGTVCEFVHNVPWCDGRKTEELLGGGDRRVQHLCHKIPDTNGTYSGTNFLQMYERGN